MAFTAQETADIESSMGDFMLKCRPSESIRDKLDLSWRFEGQSVVIFSICPNWRDESKKIEEPVAKSTYVRSVNRWRVYWRRADLKWHGYQPYPEAVFFEEFLSVVDEDAHCCFWG